jgi:hypothetical protein
LARRVEMSIVSTRQARAPRPLLHRLTQFRGRALDRFAGVLQHFSDFGDLFVGQFPGLLLDAFAHGGERLDAIAGIETGGVDLVFEPRPIGQAFVQRKRALHLDQFLVGVFQRGAGQRGAAILGGLRQRFIVRLGGPLQRGQPVLQGGKVEEWRDGLLGRRHHRHARVHRSRRTCLRRFAYCAR